MIGKGTPYGPGLQTMSPNHGDTRMKNIIASTPPTPEAMAYMKHVFTTLRKWGAGMFKTDFMLWGPSRTAAV